MRPVETSPEARSGITPPVHVVSDGAPLLDLAGDSTAGIDHARDHGFVTGMLQRTLVLGPSTLALDEGTPWFGGTQGAFVAVAAGDPGDAASAQIATANALRVLAGHATILMPWMVDPDGDDPDRVEDSLARSTAQCKQLIQRELDQLGLGGSVRVSASVAYIAWPILYCASVGDACVYLARGRELSCLVGESGGQPGAAFRAELRRGDRVLASSRALTLRASEGAPVDRALDAGDALAISRRLVGAARAAGESALCVAIARIGEPAGD